MKIPIFIMIVLGICVLLISTPFAYYRIVRDTKGIKFSFIVSSIIAIIGVFGLLGVLYKIETILYVFMFSPLIFFSIYQTLRYFYKKDTGREPVSTYASNFDFTDGRGMFVGDYIFNFLLLILTIAGIFGLQWMLK
ncbi:hypothetical protein [Prolixibacter bellariivorans]|nr:hypothetical protein [Prolixibacter bellariivorans]